MVKQHKHSCSVAITWRDGDAGQGKGKKEGEKYDIWAQSVIEMKREGSTRYAESPPCHHRCDSPCTKNRLQNHLEGSFRRLSILLGEHPLVSYIREVSRQTSKLEGGLFRPNTCARRVGWIGTTTFGPNQWRNMRHTYGRIVLTELIYLWITVLIYLSRNGKVKKRVNCLLVLREAQRAYIEYKRIPPNPRLEGYDYTTHI